MHACACSTVSIISCIVPLPVVDSRVWQSESSGCIHRQWYPGWTQLPPMHNLCRSIGHLSRPPKHCCIHIFTIHVIIYIVLTIRTPKRHSSILIPMRPASVRFILGLAIFIVVPYLYWPAESKQAALSLLSRCHRECSHITGQRRSQKMLILCRYYHCKWYQ